MPYSQKGYNAYKRRLFNKPYRFGYKSYKKYMKKRKNDWPTLCIVPRGISAFAEVTRVRMRWTGQLTPTPGLPVSDTYFEHNAIYKPYPAGATEAAGYSIWASAYNKYRVFGSTMKVSIYETQAAPQWIGIMPVPDNTQSVATTLDLRKQPMCKWKLITRNDAGEPTVIKSYCSTAKLFGVPPIAIRLEKDYSGFVGSVPPLNSQWLVRLTNDDGTNINTHCMYEINYYLEWFDRVEAFQF